MNKIVVHPGGAHVDDFLASCICVNKLKIPIYRVEFDKEMLEDPEIWVLDQGGEFNPDFHNFDHHHIDSEICSFTMILDYFYGKSYRDYFPSLRFIEIFDSYGASKAAEFAGVSRNGLDITTSIIQSYLLKSFSRIEGEVKDPFLTILDNIGFEICSKIETQNLLINSLDNGAVFFEYKNNKILDVTNCSPPEGFGHEEFPTKIWCKLKKINPNLILTKNNRVGGGYKMISINTNSVSFLPNEKSEFTHISGFLTVFQKYEDYKFILDAARKPSPL